MRALTFSRFGGPEVLAVLDLPEPQPGPDQVRIRVAAATVNPADNIIRSSSQLAQLTGKPPHIPGMEIAGIIDAIGPGSAWQVGDRVMAIVMSRRPEGGGMAELVVVPANSVARVPENVGLEHAATIPMNGLTVRHGLDQLALKPGETLAVTGAAGAVGAYTVEIGAAEGLRVVAVAEAGDEAFLKQIGAEAVVPRGENAAERIRELTPDGVDALLDAAVIGSPILPAIRDGGKLAVVKAFQGDTERGITVHRVLVNQYAENQAALDQLGRMAGQDRLTLRVAETFPPERAAEAHSKVAAGGLRGRMVIVF